MAPHGGAITSSFVKNPPPPPRLSTDSLLRTKSNLTSQLSKDVVEEAVAMEFSSSLPPISEVEDAKCNCCGMCEEYTAEYIDRVRARYSGKWICGLCVEGPEDAHERVREVQEDKGVPGAVPGRRQILKKGTTLRAKSLSPRDKEMGGQKNGVITRSSSFMPALTKELTDIGLEDSLSQSPP